MGAGVEESTERSPSWMGRASAYAKKHEFHSVEAMTNMAGRKKFITI
jgi:hypothetical protein